MGAACSGAPVERPNMSTVLERLEIRANERCVTTWLFVKRPPTRIVSHLSDRINGPSGVRGVEAPDASGPGPPAPRMAPRRSSRVEGCQPHENAKVEV